MSRQPDLSSPEPSPALRATRLRRDVSGLLLLDKPVGETSNRVLQRVKRMFAASKAGHTGSLDPLASGMLPICLGEATKISGFLLGADKTYRVMAEIGVQTDTADAEGRAIAESEPTVSREALEAALQGLQGSVAQVPPMYSALKRQGRRLYEIARAGQSVSREPRPVQIHQIVIEQFDPHRPVLRVHCGSGTYIRTLVEDIARAAGRVAHVAALRRLAVDPFRETAMISENALQDAAGQGLDALDRLLLPSDTAIAAWPAVHLSPDESADVRQGRAVHPEPLAACAPGEILVRLYDDQGCFMGVGRQLSDGTVAPRRLFNPGAELA